MPYLDTSGLEHYHKKIKNYISTNCPSLDDFNTIVNKVENGLHLTESSVKLPQYVHTLPTASESNVGTIYCLADTKNVCSGGTYDSSKQIYMCNPEISLNTGDVIVIDDDGSKVITNTPLVLINSTTSSTLVTSDTSSPRKIIYRATSSIMVKIGVPSTSSTVSITPAYGVITVNSRKYIGVNINGTYSYSLLSGYGSGRNLLLNSKGKFTKTLTTITDGLSVYTSTECFLEQGKLYTISAKTNANKFSSTHGINNTKDRCVLWIVGIDSNSHPAKIVSSESMSTDGSKGSTFVWDNSSGTYCLRTNFYIPGSWEVWEVKVEEGSVSTGWTPAPEDVLKNPMTSTVYGLGKVFSDTVQTVAANSVSTTASRTYGIQKNTGGQLVVNVPWSNTTYSAVTTSANGLMTKEDKVKLDNISKNYIEYKTSSALKVYNCDTNGMYVTLATIHIDKPYINNPIILEISGRAYHKNTVQICFNTDTGLDPGLGYFISDYDSVFYIKKTETSKWTLYAKASEAYGNFTIHQVYGKFSNMLTLEEAYSSSLPDGCIQVTTNAALDKSPIKWTLPAAAENLVGTVCYMPRKIYCYHQSQWNNEYLQLPHFYLYPNDKVRISDVSTPASTTQPLRLYKRTGSSDFVVAETGPTGSDRALEYTSTELAEFVAGSINSNSNIVVQIIRTGDVSNCDEYICIGKGDNYTWRLLRRAGVRFNKQQENSVVGLDGYSYYLLPNTYRTFSPLSNLYTLHLPKIGGGIEEEGTTIQFSFEQSSSQLPSFNSPDNMTIKNTITAGSPGTYHNVLCRYYNGTWIIKDE